MTDIDAIRSILAETVPALFAKVDELTERVADLTEQLTDAQHARSAAQCSRDLLRGHLDEQKPVIDAAKAWVKFEGLTEQNNLTAAVDALPKPTHWASIYGGCEDGCPVCKTEVTS